jgi:hypothetical protein
MNGNYLGTGLVIYGGIISGFKRVEFVTGCIEGLILRGHLCEIISVNVSAPVENKCDDTKDSFCEDQFTKYHMNIFVMFQYKDRKMRYF